MDPASNQTAANDVLDAIARNVREITMLMSNVSAHRHTCLQKLDSCSAHLASISGILEANRIADVESSLQSLRNEVMAAVDVESSGQTSYSADRPLTGMYFGLTKVTTDTTEVNIHFMLINSPDCSTGLSSWYGMVIMVGGDFIQTCMYFVSTPVMLCVLTKTHRDRPRHP